MTSLSIIKEKFISFIKKETVLAAAIAAAAVSSLFNPPSARYLSYIDTEVLLCLFCLMITVAGLKKLGAVEAAALFVATKSRNMRSLSFGILMLTYILAMFMTNDVALITLVPFTLILLNEIGQNQYSVLIVVLQTISANIGSSLTPVGNPQNLYLFSFYKLRPGEFILIVLPIVITGGILLAVSTLLIETKPIGLNKKESGFDSEKHIVEMKKNSVNKSKLIVYIILFILSILAILNLLPILWIAVITAFCIFHNDRHLFRKVDYSLLLTFIFFFVFIGNLSELSAVKEFLSAMLSKSVFLISLLTSQIISNVPAAVLLSGFTSDYKALILGVNVGGIGTLIASLASVISFKLFTGTHPGMTRRYIKVFTLLNLVYLIVLCLLAMLL